MRPPLGDHIYDFINGTREEVYKWFLYASSKIKEGTNEGLKKILIDHEELIEKRTDWKNCQKTARRKRIIAFWLSDAGLTMNDLKEKCK